MSDEATHRVERDDGVATVTLDRPDALNAQTRASRRALLRDLRTLSSDDTVRCVVLTGAGRAFSAGQDLREPDALVDVDAVIRETYIPIVETLVGMPKPVVAAINGAGGGRRPLDRPGLRPALHGRRRRADDGVLEHRPRARLRRHLAARARGRPRTRIRARRDGPARAGRRGARRSTSCSACCLATSCRPPRTRSPRELAARPTQALGWTKRLLRAAEQSALADVMELEAQLQASAVTTHDHAEGVAAFLEKREPRFEGR